MSADLRNLGRDRQEPFDVLRVEALKVHFFSREGIVQAVNGVDFRLRYGETLGVVGESGCGKSITARAILRIVPEPGKIVGGRIIFRREQQAPPIDLVQLDEEGELIRTIRGSEIGMIFQEPMTSFSPVHTIGDQIGESIRLHWKLNARQTRERTLALLDRVGIPNPAQRVDSYSFELSGGMRQRAMIAMALACDPKIQIADEPTTALDVTIQAQILDLMRDLQEELGMSTILITHDLAVIAQVAHHVVVMYMGRIVEDAPKRAIFTAPRHPYTQGLLRSVPLLGYRRQRQLVAIEGTVPPPHARIVGCPFHLRCPEVMPGLCDRVLPALVEVEPGVRVRCFLHSNEIEGTGVEITESRLHPAPQEAAPV